MATTTVGRIILFTFPAALAVLTGCGQPDGDGTPVIAYERWTRRPAAPAKPMRPLTPAMDAQTAPPSELQLPPGLAVDARVLVITADGRDAAFDAIDSTLSFLGTPRDILNATSGQPLTASMLADGDHGKYQAIFVDLGDLSVSGTSAFTSAEWAALTAYEARFGVRRVAVYAYPTMAYGLAGNGAGFNPASKPIQARCSAAGAATFVGLNCANPVTIDAGYVYPARAADAQTIPLLTDDAGNVYAATTRTPDGREALALTFAQSPNAFHTLKLGYGLVSWATRGVFVGERHAYLSAQIDDLFLASTIYPETGTTYRMTGADMQALADWQSARRANPLVAGLRLAWAANLEGARGVDRDPLNAKAVQLAPLFGWISHTWAHHDLTTMNYADAYTAFSLNDQAIRGFGLNPYAVANLVTPGITGLANAMAMRAAYDVGVRQLVSDTSVDGQDNPSPNAGRYNAMVQGILEIPRFPTDLDYDVSLPAEWQAATLGRENRNLPYDQIVAEEARVLAGHLLRGANDPWMFHQANTRDYGGGRSMLGDLLGATIDLYLAHATFPIVSPNMDELAQRVTDRMRLDASGVVATIQPDDRLTVTVTNAARVPVTGLCTPDAETYGGSKIAYLDLPARGSITLSLTNCNPGVTGTGGPGTGGTTGTGGAVGTGGTNGAGTGGTTGTGTGGVTGAGTGGATGTGTGGATGANDGGASAGTTGAAGEGGAAGSGGTASPGGPIGGGPPPDDGCAVGGEPRGTWLAVLLAAGGGLVLSRRRGGGRARPQH